MHWLGPNSGKLYFTQLFLPYNNPTFHFYKILLTRLLALSNESDVLHPQREFPACHLVYCAGVHILQRSVYRSTGP